MYVKVRIFKAEAKIREEATENNLRKQNVSVENVLRKRRRRRILEVLCGE